MLIFFFTIVILYGISVIVHGFTIACGIGLAAFIYLFMKDKTRAIQALLMLRDIATA